MWDRGRSERRGAPRRAAGPLDIRTALCHVKADTIILEGQFDFPGTTMTALARTTVAAAQSLYGKSAATDVRKAFADRGIM